MGNLLIFLVIAVSMNIRTVAKPAEDIGKTNLRNAFKTSARIPFGPG